MENNQNTIKPGMNSESKAKFFASYIGCNFISDDCLTTLDHIILDSDNPYGWINTIGQRIYTADGQIVLKDLSSITDEQDIEVTKIFYPLSENSAITEDEFSAFGINSPAKRIIELIDYLRSKGYALPFMSYSVEDMVQAGWIKLKGGK
jgi:hypothetical protein